MVLGSSSHEGERKGQGTRPDTPVSGVITCGGPGVGPRGSTLTIKSSSCSSTGAFFFAFILIFQGATCFDPIGLPQFKRVLDSFAFCPLGTSIRAGAFTAGICDFITFVALTNASDN